MCISIRLYVENISNLVVYIVKMTSIVIPQPQNPATHSSAVAYGTVMYDSQQSLEHDMRLEN